MIEPKRPTMPRNSTLLRFFTVYSWHTLEMAYRVALTRTRPSPRRMSLAVVDTGMNNGLTYITFYAILYMFWRTSLLLTRSLVLASKDIRSHHGSHPSQTYTNSYVVNDPIAGLQEEPGQDHQNRDNKAVQQLKCRQ